MKLLVLLTAIPLLAQVPQAPPPVPTPRGQPFPPRGPGGPNNPPVNTGGGAVGRTFEQATVGAPGPNLPNAGFTIDPVIVPTLTNSSAGIPPTPALTNSVPAVGTNFPDAVGTFGLVGTNFPPSRALGTNPALGRTIITSTFPVTAAPNPGLSPRFPPVPGAVGASPSVQSGSERAPVIELPPGTRIVPIPQVPAAQPPAPPPGAPVFPPTPAAPATPRPGPALRR